MHIGTLTVVLYLHETHSLKEKRQIVKSLVETSRQKFNIAIAEVDDLDLWGKATIGVVSVSNEKAHANRILDKVLEAFESNPSFEVGEAALEMI